MEFFERHLHDRHPSVLNESLFPSYEQVYLRSAKNATFLPHLLAHMPNILAKEMKCWRKSRRRMAERAIHCTCQFMWRRRSAESAWPRGILFARQAIKPRKCHLLSCNLLL